MRRSACSFAIFALILVGMGLVTAALCRGTGLAERTVDIQHPTTLLSKLDHLRAAPGPKIALVGDSLVYGDVLEEHGDSDWRRHGLTEQLADELGARTGRRPFVMNLGMNGALPADLEYLVPLVAACDVDWIVFDLHLRPFSKDFSPLDRQMSRPWLKCVSFSANGGFRWRSSDGPLARCSGHLSDYSAVWRNRSLIQENLVSTQLARRPLLRPPTPATETDVEVQLLVKLAQLRNRLKALDLGPDSPQVAALARTLTDLAGRGQKHIVFYATENPGLLPDVLEADEHATQSERVAQLVRDAQGPTGVFVPPLPELRSEHFLDFTHLNAEGYRLLARRLAAEVK